MLVSKGTATRGARGTKWGASGPGASGDNPSGWYFFSETVYEPLTDKLIACNSGCYINDKCINHVMYADDICLMAPTADAM